MKNDLISRQNAIVILDRWLQCKDYSEGEVNIMRAMRYELENLPSAQQWIPVKYRPMDDEERKDFEETYGPLADDEAVMFDCKMPQDGQEVWVCSKCGNVWQDTCQIDEGIYLEENGDWLDIVAWMPYIRPEPWKGGEA